MIPDLKKLYCSKTFST